MSTSQKEFVLEERNGYVSVPGIDPYTGKRRTIYISRDTIRFWLKTHGPGRLLDLNEIVIPSLERPRAVFSGLRDFPDRATDVDDSNSLGYISRPKFRIDWKTSTRIHGESRRLLLAAINENWVLYGWFMVDPDPVDSDLPVDHEVRFEQKLL